MAEDRKSSYVSTSVKSLKGAEPYRQRPATVLGTDDINGVLHAISEVIDNSADEVSEGYGDKVDLTMWLDGSVEIRDYGRGVPMGWNEEEKKYAWELVFCTMYASGKYDDSNYKNSTGLNGIGDTAAQFTSEYMDVVSVRDEAILTKGSKKPTYQRVRYEIHFEKGYAVSELKTTYGVDEPTGTTIKFKPDIEVFKGTDTVLIPLSTYVDRIRKKAMLYVGVTFNINYEGMQPLTVCFENGIIDFFNSATTETRLTKDPIVIKGSGEGQDVADDKHPVYKASYNIVFSFVPDGQLCECYHNGAILEQGGAAKDGFLAGILSTVVGYGIEIGKFSKSDKISPRDVEDLVAYVISTECPGYLTSYSHQTKVAINNQFIKKLVKEQTIIEFTLWAHRNKTEMDKIIAAVELNREAREKGESLKRSIINEMSKGVDGFMKAPQKLVRCLSNNPEECEIYIVEGDSAKGPCVLARDNRTQAILPLRGKILNCQKESLERILESEVIRTLIQSFGCGIEIQSKYLKDLPKFDVKKLNYGKIVICTDADDDGAHITTLIITMIYRLMPSLLKMGKVYIVQTPLFQFTYGSGKKLKHAYAYNIKERDKVKEQLIASGEKEKNIVIKRMKGLGESTAPIMHETTMDKDNRRLIQLTYPRNESEFNTLLNSLMGNDIESRRSIINAYYNDDWDDIDYMDIDDTANLHELAGYNFY